MEHIITFRCGGCGRTHRVVSDIHTLKADEAPQRITPEIIEAVQFDPHKQPWPEGVKPWPDERGIQPRDGSWGYIETLEGRTHIMVGDYIITSADGKKSLCKPSIFAKTYEVVSGGPEKHDGKLDGPNPYIVKYLLRKMPGRAIVRIGVDAVDGDEVWMSPKQALSLLAWLKQEEKTLQQLAAEG